MKITIIGWEKHNGRRGNLKNASWFKFWHSAFDSESLWDMTEAEKWVFVCCIGAASMQHLSNGEFEITEERFLYKFRLNKEVLRSSIEKMVKNKVISIDATPVQHQCNTSGAAEEIREEKRREDICSEQSLRDCIQALPIYKPIESILKQRAVSENVQKSWEQAFPDPSWLISEVRKAIAWEAANPKRHKKRFSSFMTNWLTRGWDRRQVGPSGVAQNVERNFV